MGSPSLWPDGDCLRVTHRGASSMQQSGLKAHEDRCYVPNCLWDVHCLVHAQTGRRKAADNDAGVIQMRHDYISMSLVGSWAPLSADPPSPQSSFTSLLLQLLSRIPPITMRGLLWCALIIVTCRWNWLLCAQRRPARRSLFYAGQRQDECSLCRWRHNSGALFL